MIHTPTRYARVVRALIPFAAVCGLLYLFLITFIPQHFEPGRNRQDNSPAGESLEVVYTDSADSSFSPDGLQKQERILRDGHLQQKQQQVPYPDMRDPMHPGEGGAGASWDSVVSEKDTNSIEEDGNGGVVDMGPSSRTRTRTKADEPVYEVLKANGVLVMVITSDEEVQDARETIRHIEDRFNRGRHYPWVILSPQPLSDRTQTLLQHIPSASRLITTNHNNVEEGVEEGEGDGGITAAAAITFGLIPREQWKFPRWIEALKVRNGDFSRLKLGLNATSVTVRQRRRFMSGFLAQHELLDGYEFFWRVDPGLIVFCDLDDDPMLAMKHAGQKFGESFFFSLSLMKMQTPIS